MKNLKLRTKFLLVLLSLPAMALIGYHVVAQHLFVADKLAATYDVSLRMTKATGALIANELNGVTNDLDHVTASGPLPRRVRAAARVGANAFRRDEALTADERAHFAQALKTVTAPALGAAGHAWAGRGLVLARNGADGPVLAVIDSDVLASGFARVHPERKYLIDGAGRVVLGPPESAGRLISELFTGPSLAKVLAGALPDGTQEARAANGEDVILSFARLKGLGLTVLTSADRSGLLAQVRILTIKAALLLLAVVALSVLINFFVTRSFTVNIERLSRAIKEIGAGHLDTPVEVRSNDEVGTLADGIRTMSREIRDLMSKGEAGAKLAEQLETARLVQGTLFPPDEWSDHGFQIHGYSRAADRCGGDWWFHQIMHGKLYFWIADVTGHGISAALLTSAARASAAMIEALPEMPIRECMSLMNSSIFATARGAWQVTLFMGRIELETGELTYSNASHTWPVVVRGPRERLNPRAFESLDEARGARLGDQADSSYCESRYQLRPGDRLCFYTDGILDVRNPAGRTLPERQVWQAFCRAMAENADDAGTVRAFSGQLERFRAGAGRVDDETFFLLSYESSQNLT